MTDQWDFQDKPPAVGNPRARDLMAQYWAKMYVVGNVCGLCGNSGMLVMLDGQRKPCICPGGRTIVDNMERGRG